MKSSNYKVKSFTLAELLVVMIITVIVIALAFTVLNLIKKEIGFIEKNYNKTTELLMFEQHFWFDFNKYPKVTYFQNEKKLVLESELDTVRYSFYDDYVLRNRDTLKIKIKIDKIYFQANQINEGIIDAISIDATKEIPDYSIFVFKENDATFFMNKDGF